MRKILNYRTFKNSQEFMEWQLANPLCDVMRISPVAKPALSSVVGPAPTSEPVFVVWREYVETRPTGG